MKLLKKLLNKHALLICIALYATILYIIGIGCPIRAFFGVPCPTCGMTRAIIKLFSLDIFGAFECHLLFPLAIIALIILIYAKKPFLGSKKREKYFWTVIIIAFLLYYILRLIFVRNSIFYIDTYNSMLLQLINTIRGVVE
ncbi:MAG: DUF2752 domain-containing protein [Oscillospiraceae bacterium]|nr:DUF2752 domain-containing protein [Oscillospiraceae bacterium]